MKEKIRILAALILAVSLLLPAGVTYSVTVYNVSGTDGEIYVTDSYDPITHDTTSKPLSGTELNADVVMNDTVTPGYDNHGTVGLSNNDAAKTTELTINGDVSIQHDFQANGAGIGAEAGIVTLTINGDVSAETKFATETEQVMQEDGSTLTETREEGKANGVMAVVQQPDAEAALTVNGNVKAEAYTDPERDDNNYNEIFASGAEASSEGDNSESDTQVTGDVTVLSDVKAVGLSAQSVGTDATSETSVQGDVTVDGGCEAVGIQINSVGNNALASSTVGGDLSVTAEDSGEAEEHELFAYPRAIHIRAENGGAGEVRVAGDVSIDSGSYAYGALLEVGSYNESTSGTGNSGTVEIGGSILAEGNVDADGINSQIYGKSTSDVTVGEGITAISSEGYAAGVVSMIWKEGSAKGEITGDIEVSGATGAKAVQVETLGEGSTAEYTITGDLSAKVSEAYQEEWDEATLASGVFVRNGGGDTVITTIGSIDVSGAGDANAIDFESSSSWRRIEGSDELELDDVVFTDDDLLDYSKAFNAPIYLYEAEGGTKTAVAVVREQQFDDEGRFTGYKTRYLPVEAYVPEGTTVIRHTGDVTSDDIGVSALLMGDQKLDIVVDGVLDGEEHSVVLLDDTRIGENLTLTVWKVEANEDGGIAYQTEFSGSNDTNVYEQDTASEKAIQYIIRIAEDSKERITTDAKDYMDYKVANEGETVTLKLDIPEGYDLKSVYADADKTVQILADPSGNYYLIVPRGGGVLLSMELEPKVEPEPEPEPEPRTRT